MNKENVGNLLNEIENMTTEEFTKNFFTEETVIPVAESKKEVEIKKKKNDHHTNRKLLTNDVGTWFDNLVNDFCKHDHLEKDKDLRAVFNIVSLGENLIFSAGITVYFRKKEMAEKFTKLIALQPEHYCSKPSTNFCSSNGNYSASGPAPKALRRSKSLGTFPYSVNWYVDIRGWR